jgi:hypothetical protein
VRDGAREGSAPASRVEEGRRWQAPPPGSATSMLASSAVSLRGMEWWRGSFSLRSTVACPPRRSSPTVARPHGWRNQLKAGRATCAGEEGCAGSGRRRIQSRHGRIWRPPWRDLPWSAISAASSRGESWERDGGEEETREG